MAQAYRIKPTSKRTYRFNVLPYLGRALLESGFVVFMGSALFLLIMLLSYQPSDPAWTHTAPGVPVVNRGGMVGAWFADVAFYFFGYLAYLFPLGVAFCGWRLFRNGVLWQLDAEIIIFRMFGFLVTVSSSCALAALHLGIVEGYPSSSAGGIFGDFLASWLSGGFPPRTVTVFLLVLFAAGVTLATGFSWLDILDGVGTGTMNAIRFLGRVVVRVKAWVEAEDLDNAQIGKTEPMLRTEQTEPSLTPEPAIHESKEVFVAPVVDKPPETPAPITPFTADEPPLRMTRPGKMDRVEPSFDPTESASSTDWENDGHRLDPTLEDAPVTAPESVGQPRLRIVKTLRRPTAPTPPMSLLDSAKPGRFEALSALLAARAYQTGPAELPLIVGYEADGQPCIIDLEQLPHLLMAGEDADAVTRLLHTCLLSLLYKAPPRALGLILLDSSSCDLAVYQDIPHLLQPVATSIEQAVNALVWCKKEIDRRERLLDEWQEPDIAALKQRLAEEAGDWDTEAESLPAVVVVIAELADIVAVMGDWVDTLFAKLSVKGKNTDVHLLLATHHPTADVVTATVKAGMPARVALPVNGPEASQRILDEAGAERLSPTELLYRSPSDPVPHPLRLALVGLPEVERVADFLRQIGRTKEHSLSRSHDA